MARRMRDPRRRELTFEPTSRWVRGKRGDEAVVDSRRALLVWEPPRPVPIYAFPLDDVRTDLLEPVERPPDAPAGRETFYALRGATSAWTWPDRELDGYIAFDWDAIDHWYEEDEEVFVHPRDPYHRIDVLESSRHVEVRVDDETIADTRRAALLFETGLPVRYYVPLDDIERSLLVDSDTHSECPYKGRASYYSVRIAAALHDDLAWYYADPLPCVGAIRGRVALYNERVDMVVDGQLERRPRTTWS